jgi:hypothetical protein
MATRKEPEFKIPKNLGEIPDLLHDLIDERLALQRQAEEIGKREQMLKDHLINTLPASDAFGITGKFFTAKIETKRKAVAKDWDLIYGYIIKNAKKGGFALLNRAINQAATTELWDAGKEVPGVEAFNVKTVSLTKR